MVANVADDWVVVARMRWELRRHGELLGVVAQAEDNRFDAVLAGAGAVTGTYLGNFDTVEQAQRAVLKGGR